MASYWLFTVIFVGIFALAARTLLLLGKDIASNGNGPMGTEKGKAVIAAEKRAVAPSTMPKLEAGGRILPSHRVSLMSQ